MKKEENTPNSILGIHNTQATCLIIWHGHLEPAVLICILAALLPWPTVPALLGLYSYQWHICLISIKL